VRKNGRYKWYKTLEEEYLSMIGMMTYEKILMNRIKRE